MAKNNKQDFVSQLMNNSIDPKKLNQDTNVNKIHHIPAKKNNQKKSTPVKPQRSKASTKKPKKRAKRSNSKSTKKSKKSTIVNKYGVLPMSCTLDIGTIGKLDSLKQVLGLHNRNEVVNLLLKNQQSTLLKSHEAKSNYKLYFKVFMMKHKKQAEKHYKQFYKNGKSKKNK